MLYFNNIKLRSSSEPRADINLKHCSKTTNIKNIHNSSEVIQNKITGNKGLLFYNFKGIISLRTILNYALIC
jgi:hypothetical protein